MSNLRLPQLDGLRAVAVTFVMAFHFIPSIARYVPLGAIGVRLFFVLSGFLITRILLDPSTRLQPAAGDLHGRSGLGRWTVLRAFYIRRGLRIFPLFYLVLALAALINIGPVRQTIGWHVSYLTNFYLFDRGGWHGSISHLWSLAVEEQFYLVWPLIVLLLPERRLPFAIAAMVCAAPLSRLLIGGPMDAVLPLSCVDSLGAGALLALPPARYRMMAVGFLVGVPLTLVTLAVGYWTPLAHRSLGEDGSEVVLDFGVSLAAAWIVGRAAKGFAGWIGAFLTARPVIYTGTISYGLYLYHGFMPYVLGRYITGFADMPWITRFALLTTATFATAAASWRFFEAPILTLKDRLADRRALASEPSHGDKAA